MPRLPLPRPALAAALLATSLVAAGGPRSARAGSGEEPPYDVYVIGERDLVDRVTTVRSVDREDIRDESARSLDEALRRQPSLVVRRGGEGVARIDLRGLRARQILLLLDGVPLRSTEDGNFDPSLIPSQIIERVDVSAGNSSVLYGDGALAGVLQVRSRLPHSVIESRARGDFRQGDQFLGQASVGGASRGFEGYAAGGYLSSDGFLLPRDFTATGLERGGLRDASDRTQGNAFAKLGYAPSESGRVDVLLDWRRADFGVPANVVDVDPDDFAASPRFERVHHVEGLSAQLSGQARLGEALDLRSWAFVNRQREDRARYDDAGRDSMQARNSFRLEGTTLVPGGAIHGRYDLGDFGVLRFAANGRYERFESEGRIRDVPIGGGGGGGGGSFGFRDVDETDDLGAASLGLEYALQPLAGAGIVLGYGHAFLRGDGVRDDGSLFLAGAHYDFPSATRLRASAAQRLRFPSIRQLYALDGGNADLDPERCWCFEVGISQRLARDTTLALTGFWMELRDFIERVESGGPFVNRQQLRNRGFEVEASSRPWRPLFLRVGYSFLDARDVTAGSPFDRLQSRPRHKLDAIVRYQLPWQTTLRAAFTFSADTVVYSRSDPALDARLDDFALLDLRIEQPILGSRVLVYAGVENVLDEEWSYNFGFPQPGRSVFGGVELRL